MRKLIFQQWVSMDGFAADAKGNVPFVESPALNKHSDLDQLKWLESIDTILLGRNTYNMFVQFWPTITSKQQIVADKINEIPKIVFSKSLTSAPWGKLTPATLISGDAADAVKQLKSQSGMDIVLWGSIALSQTLMRANLIDEYHIRICPFVLGSGRPLFESTGPLKFDLFESKAYESGMMLLKYSPQP